MNIKIAPPHLAGLITRSDGVTPVGFLEAMGTPLPLSSTALTGHLLCAYSPTGTTASINFTSGVADNVSISGGTARVKSAVGTGLDNTAAFIVGLFARRKPGSTGAITAQTLTLKGGSGAANTLGKVYVAAAAAGAEPVSDFLYLPRFAQPGDSLHTWSATDPVVITNTAADTDLEIVYGAIGVDTE